MKRERKINSYLDSPKIADDLENLAYIEKSKLTLVIFIRDGSTKSLVRPPSSLKKERDRLFPLSSGLPLILNPQPLPVNFAEYLQDLIVDCGYNHKLLKPEADRLTNAKLDARIVMHCADYDPALVHSITLYKSITNMEDFRGITQFPFLIDLDLAENQLTQLPEWIGDIPPLLYLEVGNNLLKTFPANFGSLHSLISLNAFHNRLNSLPDSFSELNALKFIDFSENCFQAIPKSLRTLPNLESLDLYR